MTDKKKHAKSWTWERTENLMLMSVLGQEPYRSQAIRELEKRKLIHNPDLFMDTFMTNLSVAC